MVGKIVAVSMKGRDRVKENDQVAVWEATLLIHLFLIMEPRTFPKKEINQYKNGDADKQ